MPPIEHRMLRLQTLTLHVALAGDAQAPLVLLLHGFPETWQAWERHIAPLVACGWRVAAVDQRGCGSSERPRGLRAYALDRLAADVEEVAERLGASRFSLVGHDWGGIVAWQLASARPGKVERLVILNAPHPAAMGAYLWTHPFQWLRSGYVGFFQLPLLPEAVLSAGDFALPTRALTHTSRPKTFGADLLAAYRAAWAQPGALTAMLSVYRALVLARPHPGRVQAPTLVIWGDRDTALEPGLADAALQRCDNAELVRLADATHWLHHEQPVKVSGLICDFLAQGHAPSPAPATDTPPG
ncbi:alpha/beta fold hydrolase [Xenophilus sp. Marseille-Q4582]|uniref:alpha/beta fold hydrolase n=1 Tax=Xenophilus sp. Marseille-Q4582 TaxID=2866600 RepID=UPI001CE43710|nr:alpha/beta hydrolase [Xenophilus sp. Marseille-Q4582]